MVATVRASGPGLKAGLADPNKIGIMGGSYGGYMTMAGLLPGRGARLPQGSQQGTLDGRDRALVRRTPAAGPAVTVAER